MRIDLAIGILLSIWLAACSTPSSSSFTTSGATDIVFTLSNTDDDAREDSNDESHCSDLVVEPLRFLSPLLAVDHGRHLRLRCLAPTTPSTATQLR